MPTAKTEKFFLIDASGYEPTIVGVEFGTESAAIAYATNNRDEFYEPTDGNFYVAQAVTRLEFSSIKTIKL